MSVHGEFDRILAAFVEFLEGATAPAAQEPAFTLAGIRDAQRDAGLGGRALEDSAREVLAILDRPDAPTERSFALHHERSRFRDDSDHLRAICAAILGRPERAAGEGSRG